MQFFLYRLLRPGIALGCLCLALALSSPARSQTVLVLGDSISAAYGMSLEQGWVAMMSEALAEDYPDHRMVNASISGDTTAGGLRRLPELLQQHQPAIVMLELGGNDGLRGYPIKNLRANLRQLAQLSRDSGAQVILLPVAIPPNYGNRYTSAFTQSYAVVAEETGSTLAPLIFEGVATDPTLMQPDGIHPTVAAQPLLVRNVLPTLLEVLATL
ncbi:MAG: arylesterase [Gammaproteobacteria bacterium]|jgi:acyl-CoA thioesterase-1|nr:arylesterase [Gammaproteobacteria bacterium]